MKHAINTRNETVYVDPDFSRQPYHSIDEPIDPATDNGGISFGAVIVVVFVAFVLVYAGYQGLQLLQVIK